MKFEELEERYEIGLLQSVFGTGYQSGISSKLSSDTVGRKCKFEGKINKGALEIRAVDIDRGAMHLEPYLDKIILMIFVVIEEKESKKFLFFGKKIDRNMKVHVKFHELWFKGNPDRMKSFIESFKSRLESESGIQKIEFLFEPIQVEKRFESMYK